MTFTDLEMLMEKLKRLLYDTASISIGNKPFIEAKKPDIWLLYEELGYLIGFCFRNPLLLLSRQERRLIEAADKAEDIVDMFISFAFIKNNDADIQNEFGRELAPFVKDNLLDCYLIDVMDDIKAIREDIMSNKKQEMMMDNQSEATGTTVSLSATEHEEVIVGFDDDSLLILDRLTGYRKKLDVISIVGMGGLGKTTLATKIYSRVRCSFHLCGWVSVSQAYSKRDMLVQLLASIGRSVDEAASDSKLYEMLYKSLKGRKYY